MSKLSNHQDWPYVRHYIKQMLKNGYRITDPDGSDITHLIYEMTEQTAEPLFAATDPVDEAERILQDGWDDAMKDYNDYRRVCRRNGHEPVSIQAWATAKADVDERGTK